MIRARSDEMSEEAPQTLPPLGTHRPMRADAVPLDGAGPAVALLLRPEDLLPKRTAPPADDAPTLAPTLAPADPDGAPRAAERTPIRRSAVVLAALGAHALVLFALVSVPASQLGQGGVSLEAISVSIIPARVLEGFHAAAEPRESATAAPSAGAPAEASAAREAPDEQRPPQAARPPDPAPPAGAAPVLDTVPAAPAETAPKLVPDEAPTVTDASATPEETAVQPPAPLPPETPPAQPSPASAAADGAMAEGVSENASAPPAAAAASAGEIDAYGMALQAALLAVDQREAKARASASQATGTVIVRLALDEKGALINVEVVQSSGRPQLDEAALLLIRLAHFPPPPPGLSAAERAYLAPIRFR